MKGHSTTRLSRILSPLETRGFGFTGLLLWLLVAPEIHAALIGAIAWPVVLIIFLLSCQKPIREFLDKQPVRNISVGGVFSAEFGEVKEMTPKWSDQDLPTGLRKPTPSANITDSMATAFLEQLRNTFLRTTLS